MKQMSLRIKLLLPIGLFTMLVGVGIVWYVQRLAAEQADQATLDQAKSLAETGAHTIPLVIASGAGAEMRRSLGVSVFSGMLGVTAFGIFLTPVFYYVVEWFGQTDPPRTATGEPTLGLGGHPVQPEPTSVNG